LLRRLGAHQKQRREAIHEELGTTSLRHGTMEQNEIFCKLRHGQKAVLTLNPLQRCSACFAADSHIKQIRWWTNLSQKEEHIRHGSNGTLKA